MKQVFMIAVCAGLISVSGWSMGRKNGDGYDIQPVKKGSAANPNPAFTPPSWGDEPRSIYAEERKPKKAGKSKANAKNTVPDEPDAPKESPDAFPDYAAPQADASIPMVPIKATPKDSLEPPLPDEPGGDPDKRPSK